MSIFDKRKSYRDTSVELKAVTEFEPKRYLGLWFGIGGYPAPQWAEGFNSVVQYGLREDGDISVVNSMHINSPTGEIKVAEGKAEIVGTAKLNVKFSALDFNDDADYVVIGLKPDYSLAVVGIETGTYASVLCRSRHCSDEDMAWAKGVLKDNGYDLTEFRMVEHNG